ncbi:AI-2E family transporter [Naumannella halotolerans]|uniref:AI-2E family transporter n=1 Tax=Naumannella halotolerans TaxID=993414 RepID=UPI00370DCC1B
MSSDPWERSSWPEAAPAGSLADDRPDSPSERAAEDPGPRRGPVERDSAPPIPAASLRRRGLTDQSPFGIGFFGTLGALAALAVGTALLQLQTLVLLIVLSLFIALGANPVVEFWIRRGVRRGLAVLGVVLVGLGLLALGLAAVLPVALAQVNQLGTAVPIALERLAQLPQLAALDADYQLTERLTGFIASGQWADRAFGGILGAGVFVANSVFSLVVTVVLTIYFLISLPTIKRTIYQLAPASRRPRARYLADKTMRQVGGYLSGMAVVSLCSATFAFIFLNIIGMGRYGLALAFVVAIFAFIPLVGSTISLIIVTLICFAVGVVPGVAYLIYGIVYQQLDAYLIQPRIFHRSVNIPGVVVVIAATAGGLLNGVLGAILAIPMAAVIMVLYRDVLIPRLDRS